MDSAAIVTAASRSASSAGSKTRSAEVRPVFSSPPNARRNGSSDGNTAGRVNRAQVSWESSPVERMRRRLLSPTISPRAVKRLSSPSTRALIDRRRSARSSSAWLRAVVRCRRPSAGTSMTSTSSTRTVSWRVSIVVEAKPICWAPTVMR